MTPRPERVRPPEVANMTGLSVRKVQELSAAGRIPGAAKLGGVWTYDPEQVRKWIKQRERQTWRGDSPSIATSATASSGDVSSSVAESIDVAFSHLIPGKRPNGSRRGSSSSNATKWASRTVIR